MIERDRDVFGHTVNLASRIADVAGPGEVLTTEAIVEATASAAATFGFGGSRTPSLRASPARSPSSRHVMD